MSQISHIHQHSDKFSVVLFSVADSLMWLGVCLVSKLPQTSSAFCLCIPMSGFIAPINHYFSNTCHDQDLCWVHRGGREALCSSFPGAFRPVAETGGTCVRRKCTFPERMGWGEDNPTARSQVNHGWDSAGIQTNPLQGRPLFRERGAKRRSPTADGSISGPCHPLSRSSAADMIQSWLSC